MYNFMSSFNNFGTIKTQELIQEFNWNKKDFYSYLITFNEYDGFFRIVRQSDHEQALIGAQVLFNYSSEEERIVKYRIIGYKEYKSNKVDRVKELINKRKK